MKSIIKYAIFFKNNVSNSIMKLFATSFSFQQRVECYFSDLDVYWCYIKPLQKLFMIDSTLCTD